MEVYTKGYFLKHINKNLVQDNYVDNSMSMSIQISLDTNMS